MNASRLVTEAYDLFGVLPAPTIIYSETEGPVDPDRLRIQSDFVNKHPSQLSTAECVDMILDFTLINDEAVMYFLPRLLEAVMLENKWHEDSLRERLQLITNTPNTGIESFLQKIIEALAQLQTERASLE